MKILLCTSTYRSVTHGPAKFAQQVHKILEFFPDHEITIVTENPPSQQSAYIEEVKVRCPRPFHALINFFRMVAYHARASRIHRESGIDLIIYNHALEGFLSAIIWRNKVPVIGMLNDYENIRIAWKNAKSLPFRKWLIRSLLRAIEQCTAKVSARIVADSHYLANRIISEYAINEDRVVTLHQGIEIKKYPFHISRDIQPNRAIKVLFVKSDFTRGGLHVLVKALGQLAVYRFELIIVGPGIMHVKKCISPVMYSPKLKISFLGPLPPVAVRKLLLSSDILCIPSLREALGVANIEGLASGIPVVSTNVGGIPEVLGNGEFGWMAEPGDAESLATCLEECITQPSLRMAKSRAGRKHVETHFRHDIMLKRFISILENSLSSELEQ